MMAEIHGVGRGAKCSRERGVGGDNGWVAAKGALQGKSSMVLVAGAPSLCIRAGSVAPMEMP
jgi:hypothetical protein